MKPPTDSWDAEGWLRFLKSQTDDWNSPGGLSYETCWDRLILSVVPDGWIKPGYGPTAKGKERKDIGKGHATFLAMYRSGAFNPLAIAKNGEVTFDREIVDYFFRRSVDAITEPDPRFFPDFWQAVEDWRECVEINQPLLKAANRNHEFMVLTALLEDGSPTFTVKRLRELVARRFKVDLSWKAVNRVKNRLAIR